ncbi:MAG: hypothetical protein OXF06_08320, partial [Bacteroidetes bacterium]|nr:hypothetical protein [Bacteroidota bacterium]
MKDYDPNENPYELKRSSHHDVPNRNRPIHQERVQKSYDLKNWGGRTEESMWSESLATPGITANNKKKLITDIIQMNVLNMSLLQNLRINSKKRTRRASVH